MVVAVAAFFNHRGVTWHEPAATWFELWPGRPKPNRYSRGTVLPITEV